MPWQSSRGMLTSVATLAIVSGGGGAPSTYDFMPGFIPSGITFSRTTQGSYFNASGVLTLAAVDAPRFNYDPSTLALKGLLLDPAATNLCLYSQDFSNASWGTYSDGDGSITKTAAAAVAPDGTTTAGKIDLNRGVTASFAEAYVIYTGTAASYAHSLWFKAFAIGDVGKKVMFSCYNGSAAGGTVEVTLTANWKRETVTGTMASASCQMNIGYLSAAGFPGTSNPIGAVSFYIWGGQIETGTIATSYIPTTSSSVIRAADIVKVIGADFSSFYNAAEGSWIFDVVPSTIGESTFLWTTNATSWPNSLGVTKSANEWHAFVTDSSTETVAITTTGNAALIESKVGFAYKFNDCALVVNGTVIGTDISVTIPTAPNQLQIGSRDGVSVMNMHLKKIRYFNTRQSNTDLQTLTS